MPQTAKSEQVKTEGSQELNLPPDFARNLITAVNKLGAMVAEMGYGPDFAEDNGGGTAGDKIDSFLGSHYKGYKITPTPADPELSEALLIAEDVRAARSHCVSFTLDYQDNPEAPIALEPSITLGLDDPTVIYMRCGYTGLVFGARLVGRDDLQINNYDWVSDFGIIKMSLNNPNICVLEGGDEVTMKEYDLVERANTQLEAINQLARILNENQWQLLES